MQICEQSPKFIGQYAAIPIAFEVRERLLVETIADGLEGLRLIRRVIDVPYVKDYDALPGQPPEEWSKRWDLDKWAFGTAFSDDGLVGCVAVVIDTSQMYGERSDAAEAVLWDIRVRPDQRKCGVGRQLLTFAEHRARLAEKQRISVETQNNNIPACHLYASAGYTLRSIDRFAYPMLPDEVQLIWSKRLNGPRSIG